MKTLSIYIMLCGADKVPEQSGLTKEECANVLMETCENYAVDRVLHVHSDDGIRFETDDVTDEIFAAPFNADIDGSDPDELNPQDYKGLMRELMEEYIEQHPSTIEGRRGDYERDLRGGR